MKSRVPLAPGAAEKPQSPSPQPVVPGSMADLLVAYLEQLGVDCVFGVPGGLIEPFYDAMARSERRGGLRHVLARHEAGAAFMADGYARETGRLGVCCATAGPGATNLLTGVACAYENGVPLLVLTGQPALPNFGRHALQESVDTGVNTLGMFAHCTRYNSLVTHPAQFERKLFAALQQATRGERGPVHLSVPVDVFRGPVAEPAAYDLATLLQPAELVDEAALSRLRALLHEARKVVLVIGAGCDRAIAQVLQFADYIGASLVTTPDGKGLLSPLHPRCHGVFGFAGHASAEAALRDPEVDVILAVGASLGEWNSGGWSESLLNERLVHVDESEARLALTPMARLQVRGQLTAVFTRLLELELRAAEGNAMLAPTLDAPAQFDSAATPIKPQRLMRELGRRLPPGTRFLADTGNSMAWAVHYLSPDSDRRVRERRQKGLLRKTGSGRRQSLGGWLRVAMNFAPMGWAIGAAVGTALADDSVPVVCITGDGSLLMNGQEMSVAVAARRAVVFVVLNDGALGMVRHGQRLAQAEQVGCALPPTDFAALARALGAYAHVIRTPEDFEALDFADICARPGPTLLDVRIDPEEVPPMKVRMRVLAKQERTQP
jgi:acetolactate synthase-1/2/3 large subunit